MNKKDGLGRQGWRELCRRRARKLWGASPHPPESLTTPLTPPVVNHPRAGAAVKRDSGAGTDGERDFAAGPARKGAGARASSRKTESHCGLLPKVETRGTPPRMGGCKNDAGHGSPLPFTMPVCVWDDGEGLRPAAARLRSAVADAAGTGEPHRVFPVYLGTRQGL